MNQKPENLYTEGQFVEFLESCFGGMLRTGAGDNANYTFICPICREVKGREYSKKKLAIKLAGTAHLTKCWVCGYKSKNLLYLIKKYKPHFLQPYIEKFLAAKNLNAVDDASLHAKSDKLILPSGFILLANVDSLDAKTRLRTRPFLSYLKIRYNDEYSETLLWKWKFGITFDDQFYKNRIIMPSFDQEGMLNYYTSRAIDGRIKPKYLNPNVAREDVVFNELDLDWQKPLVIVEGPFDLIKCPKNSTCLLGSDLTDEYKLFQNIIRYQTPVVLALDNDPTGLMKMQKIANDLHEYGIQVSVLAYPDEIKDPGDLDKDQFKQLIDDASLYSRVYSIKSKIAKLI